MPQYEMLRDRTCCPSILLNLSGASLAVFGFALADTFLVEKIGEVDLSGQPPQRRERAFYRACRILMEVRSTLTELKALYLGAYARQDAAAGAAEGAGVVAAAGIAPHQAGPHAEAPDSRLPSPTLKPGPDFNDKDLRLGSRLISDYSSRAHSRSLVFSAIYDKQPVVAKICDHYNAEAHRLLAEQELAPHLLFVAELVGGGCIAVMRYVEYGLPADKVFGIGKKLSESATGDVARALEFLHAQNIVHGDVRLEHVIVYRADNPQAPGEKVWRANLIDFCVSGVAEVNKYPPFLRVPQGKSWVEGVGVGRPMKKEHDVQMFDLIRHT